MFHNKAEAKEKIKKNDLSVNKFIRLGNIKITTKNIRWAEKKNRL